MLARTPRSLFTCDDGKLVDACKCGRDHVKDAGTLMRRDPTQTLDLRRAFRHGLDKRWQGVAKLVVQAVSKEDRFGLGMMTPSTIGLIEANGNVVAAFQSWFDTLLNEVVLGMDRDVWIGSYIARGFERGWTRASLQTSTTFPVAYDRASVITALAVTELQGAMEATSQQAMRAFSNGLINRSTPRKVAAEIKDRVIAIGRTRSRATADAMIVRAHAEATLDVFELAGVKAVGLVPEHVVRPKITTDTPSGRTIRRIRRGERRLQRLKRVDVLTAGDDDVCEECEDIADEGPYTVSQARGLIPAHPHCRCAFVPAEDARYADDSLPPIIAEFAIDPEPSVAYLGIDGMVLRTGMQIRIQRDATLAHTVSAALLDGAEQVLEVDLNSVPRFADLVGVHVPGGIVLTIGVHDLVLDVWMATAT